jgi:periplasmic divalent cation tolerance protein
LVERQLAAAVQIVGPVLSRYRWQGKVQRKQEWIPIIKTSDRCEAAIERGIKELHRYELLGIMKLSIAGGESQYLPWILDQSTTASR